MESNRLPPPYKGGTLTDELQAHFNLVKSEGTISESAYFFKVQASLASGCQRPKKLLNYGYL